MDNQVRLTDKEWDLIKDLRNQRARSKALIIIDDNKQPEIHYVITYWRKSGRK